MATRLCVSLHGVCATVHMALPNIDNNAHLLKSLAVKTDLWLCQSEAGQNSSVVLGGSVNARLCRPILLLFCLNMRKHKSRYDGRNESEQTQRDGKLIRINILHFQNTTFFF